jgi:hypothetical protein
MRGTPLLAAAVLAACAGPQSGAAAPHDPVAPPPLQAGGPLGAVVVEGIALDASAFAAEMALLFPEQSAEVVRSLLRAAFARREAERLGLDADPAEVEASLATMAEELGDALSREDWARSRYGLSWAEVRAAYATRLRANQLYQLVLRADAVASGRLRVRWFLLADEGDADAVADRLRLGATPGAVAAATLQPDAPEDLLPSYLPRPWRDALAEAALGDVVGPLRFDGDRIWRVAVLLERLPPGTVPAREALLDGLRERPISAVEARAWFEEMLRRYTATTGPLPVSSPTPVLERNR